MISAATAPLLECLIGSEEVRLMAPYSIGRATLVPSLTPAFAAAAPSRILTSGSESSFDVDDEDDCEIWAATILADVQDDKDDGYSLDRSRSDSVCSPQPFPSSTDVDKLSSSPRGFVKFIDNEVKIMLFIPIHHMFLL